MPSTLSRIAVHTQAMLCHRTCGSAVQCLPLAHRRTSWRGLYVSDEVQTLEDVTILKYFLSAVRNPNYVCDLTFPGISRAEVKEPVVYWLEFLQKKIIAV